MAGESFISFLSPWSLATICNSLASSERLASFKVVDSIPDATNSCPPASSPFDDAVGGSAAGWRWLEGSAVVASSVGEAWSFNNSSIGPEEGDMFTRSDWLSLLRPLCLPAGGGVVGSLRISFCKYSRHMYRPDGFASTASRGLARGVCPGKIEDQEAGPMVGCMLGCPEQSK